MTKHQMINQDSGNTDFYTPPFILAAARQVLTVIDLDPSSSETANKNVQAKKFFTIADDALNRPWLGNVWMNHPFSKLNNKDWIIKLVGEYGLRHTKSALCICYAATSEKWFRPLLRFPQCFLHGRTDYYLPSGEKKSGVTKGSVVTYLGDDLKSFSDVFGKLGTVKIAV